MNIKTTEQNSSNRLEEADQIGTQTQFAKFFIIQLLQNWHKNSIQYMHLITYLFARKPL